MYPKSFTEKVLELQTHGFTAEESISYFKEHGYKHVGLATVYRHRTNALAKEITEETLRQQRRSILKNEESHPELSMKYRNEILKLMIPQMTINYNKTESTENVNVNVTADLLKQYENLFEEATLLENCAPQQLHTTQTHNKTSPSTTA